MTLVSMNTRGWQRRRRYSFVRSMASWGRAGGPRATIRPRWRGWVDYQVSRAFTQIGDLRGKDHHEGRLASTGRPVIPIVKTFVCTPEIASSIRLEPSSPHSISLRTFASAIDHQPALRVVSRSISSVGAGGVRAI